ncbi:IS701 family transposase [Nitrosococcus wardiae]|uniref:IS701 family transposase n=1 Tax=Nitrosococcus wardiae TaxID=1814290 RepID=A0A4P7C0S4_9GAMM|nr:IS701 family transposase [Nitrosococcus wardiae]QBQ54442.1 IS701 family transposase [Nitrosococcus wardiae]
MKNLKGGSESRFDDSRLDKPYAKKMGLVSRHWSGKHPAVVKGINLISLLWTEGDSHLPCDYRLYDKVHDALTKNDHFLALLQSARERGFEPEGVVFIAGMPSLANLKAIRGYGWIWLTQLKANRLVSQNYQGKVPVSRLALDEAGSIVHLKGYGLIKVFRGVTPDGDTPHWATHALQMTGLLRLSLAERVWTIEEYHRGIKQFSGLSVAKLGPPKPNAILLGWACARFCAWSAIIIANLSAFASVMRMTTWLKAEQSRYVV